MRKIREPFKRKLLVSAAGFAVAAMLLIFGVANATPSLAKPQDQSPVRTPAPAAPTYEFDVATIKPSPPTAGNGGVAGFFADDSFQAKNYTLRAVLLWAYGMWAGRDETVLGGPKWLDTDKYYITAKMDSTVADKLMKLTPDQRQLAREQMVQALLADRLKLTVHREPRELPIYLLTLAKNGPKLKESKPGDTYEKAFPYADNFADPVRAGVCFTVGNGSGDQRTMTLYCFGVSTFGLARGLKFWSGRPVQDMTGLKGSYDFTLTWGFSPAASGSSAAGSDSQSVPSASDPSGAPDLFAAVQQQLGLKLESTKGPVEIIVIDHVERPSGN
jgi:uncharacterized protein (TIGR03435 family)